MTIAELRSRLSYEEYLEWRAYFQWLAWKQAPPAHTFTAGR